MERNLGKNHVEDDNTLESLKKNTKNYLNLAPTVMWFSDFNVHRKIIFKIRPNRNLQFLYLLGLFFKMHEYVYKICKYNCHNEQYD